MTDHATGNVVQDELHYPWGQEWTMAGSMEEERFAGMQHRDSETTLDPTHFRMFSSGAGRWLTPDPAQADVYNPQSMSRYAYAGNNPSSLTDPTGLFEHVPPGCVTTASGFGYTCPPPFLTAGYPGCVAYGSEGCIQPPCRTMPGVAGCPPVYTPSAGGGPVIGPAPEPTPAPAPPPSLPLCITTWVKDFAQNLGIPVPQLEAGLGSAVASASYWATFKANVYAAERGLIVPLRSSIYRRWIIATDVIEVAGRAYSLIAVAVAAARADYQALQSRLNRSCKGGF